MLDLRIIAIQKFNLDYFAVISGGVIITTFMSLQGAQSYVRQMYNKTQPLKTQEEKPRLFNNRGLRKTFMGNKPSKTLS